MVAKVASQGRWSRSSSGDAAHGRQPARGTDLVARREPSSRHPDPRLVRSGGRVALAAVFAAATLLSPGARDACAGCCSDEAPAVAASLAAGIAPVHACCAAPVPAAPAGCCNAAPERAAGPDGAESGDSAAERSDCGCHLGSREGLPADPTRRVLEERPIEGALPPFPAAGSFPQASDACLSTWSVVTMNAPGRPARILYGVWRN